MNGTVSEKGQLTIPKHLRDRLGLSKGTVVEFAEDQGRLVIVKADQQDPVDRYYGILRDRVSDTDAYVAELRGDEP